METRADRAYNYFKEGCNCSQAVFLAFADKYDIDKSTALRISSSFGGGMGRMREICGAFSGMLLVNGLEMGSGDLSDYSAKAENYKKVQELAEKFKAENGSLYCRELLEMTKKAVQNESYKPSERTQQYYKKRPCAEIVRSAAKILQEEFRE